MCKIPEVCRNLPAKQYNFSNLLSPFANSMAAVIAVFHIWPKVSETFPDSSLLIMVGLVVGIVLSVLKVDRDRFSLESHVFFLYLLPPLVFNAGILLST